MAGAVALKPGRSTVFYSARNRVDLSAVGPKLHQTMPHSVISVRGGSTLSSDEGASSSVAEKLLEKSASETKKGTFFRLNVVYPILRSALSTIITDSDVLDVLTHILSVVTWMYLALSVLGTWGIDTKPVLSLLGIGGLTVGFSAQSLLADSYAGLVLLFIRPFQRGDVITVNGLKGKVLSVDMRYVRLYSVAEKCEILIPVSTVYKSDIKIDRSSPQ